MYVKLHSVVVKIGRYRCSTLKILLFLGNLDIHLDFGSKLNLVIKSFLTPSRM